MVHVKWSSRAVLAHRDEHVLGFLLCVGYCKVLVFGRGCGARHPADAQHVKEHYREKCSLFSPRLISTYTYHVVHKSQRTSPSRRRPTHDRLELLYTQYAYVGCTEYTTVGTRCENTTRPLLE